jgi:hypothetical protein
MRIKLLSFISLLSFSGCYIGDPTYEVFESARNIQIGYSSIPIANSEYREIYSEDKYIYKMERPKGCHFGFLTNRDDKPEKVIGWTILSGKEYCKEKQAWALSF